MCGTVRTPTWLVPSCLNFGSNLAALDLSFHPSVQSVHESRHHWKVGGMQTLGVFQQQFNISSIVSNSGTIRCHNRLNEN